MSGALAERDFVTKMRKAGFTDVEVVERTPLGIDQCADSPLFTPDLIELMRRLIAPEKQGEVAIAIVVRARRP